MNVAIVRILIHVAWPIAITLGAFNALFVCLRSRERPGSIHLTYNLPALVDSQMIPCSAPSGLHKAGPMVVGNPKIAFSQSLI